MIQSDKKKGREQSSNAAVCVCVMSLTMRDNNHTLIRLSAAVTVTHAHGNILYTPSTTFDFRKLRVAITTKGGVRNSCQSILTFSISARCYVLSAHFVSVIYDN